MISVESALALIDQNTTILSADSVVLKDALNHILAEDIFSPICMPPFRQSAMDGYALNHSSAISTYKLTGEIAAGSNQMYELKPGEAVRIFTGAPVPDSSNTIIQQELVNLDNGLITFTAEVKDGMNIRPKGEQIQKGELALRKNQELNPAAIGFLASLGIVTVKVLKKPQIGLLITGNELAKAGQALNEGQIYESNSLMLEAALKASLNHIPESVSVSDSLQETEKAIANLLQNNDLILISGGISVGDYDYVKPALQNLGVQEIFHKIKQKPGKPIYFGKLGKKLIFALPGNPASALMCFYIYVLPALKKMCGREFSGLKKTSHQLITPYEKKPGLAHFLKSRLSEKGAEILEAQSSAMLNTFATANALVFIPEDVSRIESGTLVTVYNLDFE